LARSTSGLSEPITILEVERGPFEAIVSGPPPFSGGPLTPEQLAKLARPAWHVQIQGLVAEPCADSKALLPCGIQVLDYIFDQETAELIYSETPG
jgi:hypothetical protein